MQKCQGFVKSSRYDDYDERFQHHLWGDDIRGLWRKDGKSGKNVRVFGAVLKDL